MNSFLTRRIYIAGIVLALSLVLFVAGYNQESAEAYLFPVIVAFIMLMCSLISIVREAMNLCLEDFQEFPFRTQIPVLLIMVLGVSLVEILGMFSTTFLVLLSVSYWYSPIEENNKRLIRSLIFSGGFSLAMYLLFAVMLNVQLPRGWLF